MFYSSDLLTQRESGFGLLWLAATLGSKSTLKRLTKKSVLTADISHLCDMVAAPAEPLALRLSSNLMVGIARVYKLKHEIFVTDVTTIHSSLKKANLLASSTMPVDPVSLLMKKASTAMDKITLSIEDTYSFGMSLDDICVEWNTQDADEQEPSFEVSQVLGDRSLHTLDEAHLQGPLVQESDDLLYNLPVAEEADDLGLDDWLTEPSSNIPIADADNNYMDIDAIGQDAVAGEVTTAFEAQGNPPKSSPVREEKIESRLEKPKKRGREFDDEDLAGDRLGTPRPILRLGGLLSDVGNLVEDQGPMAFEDFQTNDYETPRFNLDMPLEEHPGVAPGATAAKQPKKTKKKVRLLLDIRTELTDEELKNAKDNYLKEQARLRSVLQQERMNREIAERARNLIFEPPSIIEAEPLRDLWTSNFLAQIETKTGSITLIDAEPKIRAKKRRRIDSSDFEVELGRGKLSTGRGESIQPQDGEFPMGPEYNDPYDQGYDLAAMGVDDNVGPFTIGSDRIRSSEEPEFPRNAPSRPPSVYSAGIPRGRDAAGGSHGNEMDFPWTHAAPISSSVNEGFGGGGSTGQRGSGRGSLAHDVADTNIKLLHSADQSRRGSVSSNQFREGSLELPDDAGDLLMDDYRLPIDDERGLVAETQLSEITAETLERNTLNFLVYTKMQQNLSGDNVVTLGTIVGLSHLLRPPGFPWPNLPPTSAASTAV